jgi:hypothetical protein
LNIPGTSPYSLILDNTTTFTLRSDEFLPDPNAPDVGLPAMTTDGGATFGNIKGIGIGFWEASGLHPTGNPLPRSVLIESMKFETVPQAVGLAGDFNNDAKVDAADYATWRKNETANAALPNDNGLATQAARYALWHSNFGNPPGAGSGLSGGEVPEPTSVGLLLVGVVVGRLARRQRRAG